MNFFRFLPFLSLCLCSFSSTYSQAPANGNLVIVGGGLEADNKSVFQQLISLAGGAEKATIGVLPSASGTPMQSYIYFRNILISYGVKPENINLVKVALLDDDSTKDINESEWRENGNDTRVADLVKKCTGIWFSGGDQSRTMRTLVHADGSQTPVLEAVWDVFRSGGVIGGTSAGAAIMSEVMIGGGTSMAALCHGVVTDYTGDDFPEGQGVWVTRGLGFFPCGVVDQHFNARARFGRLAVTLMNNRKAGNLGFGIDENTALIYNRKQNRMQVAGVGGVTMLNTTDARIFYVQKLPVMENLAVSYLGEGDSYDFTTGTVTPAEGKKPIHGSEHYKDRYAGQDGILSPAPPNFRDLITTQLADNKATDTIQNITFLSSVSGFRVTLRKTPSSEGFHAGKPVHGDPYTVTGIRMDITPVSISATPLNNK